MLSNELEYCLNEAFQAAREVRHEFMTVEHLLLSILDTPKVREILRACGADTHKLKSELKTFIDETTPRLAEDDETRTAAAYGTNYERLRRVKAAYDPENLFRVNRNVAPAG